MEWIQLYNGVKIPVLGFGVWQCGDATKDTVVSALHMGYRMIDTSAQYGSCGTMTFEKEEQSKHSWKVFVD